MDRLIAACCLLFLSANLFAGVAINPAYGKLPLSFEPNRGQTGSQVRFLARGRGLTLFFQEDGLALTLQPRTGTGRADTLRLHFLGANPQPLIREVGALPGTVSYYLGSDRSKWRTGIPTFARLEYLEVYPGIDLVYYGNEGQMEFDWIVRPGADPRQIRLSIEGAQKMSVDAGGDLLLNLSGGRLRLRQPVAYQEAKGKRRPVSVSYNLQSEICNLQLARYDRSLPLVIDPVLIYSTYLGGSAEDNANAIAVDGSQNAYITGRTTSSDFPVLTDTLSGASDAFVTKLNAAGTARLYSTYLGGSLSDIANGIAVDGSGNAYITGSTDSTDFPTASAAQGTFGGATDVFITKLDSSGALSYSTYLGGSGTEVGRGIAVDGIGRAYISGETDGSFPTTSPFQASIGGGTDAFITRFTAAGAVDYSSYLGGTGADFGRAVAVDSSSNAYVTGRATSGFPLTNPLYTYVSIGFMAFVTKINSTGSAVTFSTYLGSTVNDFGFAIAVDGSSNIYVGGSTQSSGFPTTGGAYQTTFGGVEDGFITKINAATTALVYSTFLGGTSTDIVRSLAVNSFGDVWVTGETSSTNFPTQLPLQVANAGAFDVFVSRLSSTGASLPLSTYLGGAGSDFGFGIALDSLGAAYVAGQTSSDPFPTTVGAFQTTYGTGTMDAFVSKLQGSADVSISGVSAPSPVALGGPITYTLTVTNGGPDHASGVSLSFSAPAQVTVTGASSTQGGCTFTSSSAFCSVGAMAPAAVVTVTIPGTVAASSPGVITASTLMTHLDNDSNSGNNTANIVTAVGCSNSFVPASGAFETAANWTSGTVPAGTDNACIAAGKTATLTTGVSMRSLTVDGTLDFSGGSLAPSTAATINGTLNWTTGTLAGTGATTIAAAGTANLSGSADKLIEGGHTLNNAGTVVWTGTGGLDLRNTTATINNLTGGLFDAQSDSAVFCGFNCGAFTFNNAGTFRKSGGTGITGVSVPFTNSGTVNVQTGTVSINSGGSGAGTFSAATAAFLLFPTSFTFNSGAAFTGTGAVRFTAGTATFSGSISSQNFELAGGSLVGTQTVSGTWSWTSGTMAGADTTTIPAGGTLNISGSADKLIQGGHILSNAGTVVWTGTGNLDLRNSTATINNLAGGLFHAQNDARIFCGFNCGAFAFNNAGTFRKSVGIGTTSVDTGVAYNNTATVSVQTGTLSIASGGTASGTFDAGLGTIIIFPTSHTFNTGTAFTGTGAVRFTAGTAAFSGSISSQNFEFAGGTRTGTATVSGTWSWTGGTMAGSTTTTIAAGGTLNISGSATKFMEGGHVLSNAGTVVWTGTGNLDLRNSTATIANLAGGLFDVQNDASIFCGFNCGAFNINNAGTFRKSAGPGTTTAAVGVNNTGTVDVQSGTLALSGGGTSGGTYSVAALATLSYTGGTHTFTSAANYGGDGGVLVNGASAVYNAGATFTISLTINAGGVFANGATPVAGTTVLFSGGTLGGTGVFSASGTFTWSGGTMNNSGTTSILLGAVMNVSGSATKFMEGGHILGNAGTVVWTGTGPIDMRNTVATINNLAGGLFDTQNDVSVFCGFNCGLLTFNNTGIFRKSSSTGTTTISVPFNNSGTIDVQTGTLVINGGSGAGTFGAAAGANLTINSYTFNTGATFTGAGTIQAPSSSASGTVTFQNFTLSTGTQFNLTGTMNITGTFNWTGGVLSGTGTTNIAAGAALVMSGPDDKLMQGGHTLNNAGTVTWTGAGRLDMRNTTATINNLTGGLFDAQSDSAIFCGFNCGAFTFNNAGTFRKSGGAGTTSMVVPFTNSGTVNVQTGTVSINSGGSGAGAFSAATGALLLFPNSYTFNSGASFTGAGAVRFTAGAATFNGSISSQNFEFAGGSLAGTHTVSGTWSWTGGTMAGSTTSTIPAGGTLNISGSADKLIEGGHILSNAGTVVWTGTGNLDLRNSTATINNLAGGLFDAQNDGSIFCGFNCGAFAFNNAGTFRKSVGTGTTSVVVPFNNTGTVNVQGGTLTINAGGSSTSVFNAASGAFILFPNSYTFNSGTALAGVGVKRFTAGTATFSGSIASQNFEFAGGALVGTATVSGTWSWTGGTMLGAATTTVASGGTLNISGAAVKFMEGGHVLSNAGTMVWTGTGGLDLRNSTATINNLAGGLFDIQNDAAIFCGFNCGPTFLTNAGTLRKSAGTGTTTISVNFNTSGSVNAVTGTLSFSNYTQTLGMTVLSGGAISAPMTLAGGLLTGAGTFTGNVNNTGGQVAPGLSPGILNITGSYTQAASGTLAIELGGNTVGTYDQLLVSGTATLAGTLAVAYTGGFTAAAPDTFTILTAGARSGTFTTFTGLSATLTYNPSTTAVLSSVTGTTSTSTTTLAGSPNPSTFGSPVTLTATVSPSSATGTVTFYDGTTVLGSATLSTGQATLVTRFLPSGVRFLKAYYSGDATYLASTSPNVSQTVTVLAQSGFQAAVNYGAGTYPRSVAAGDFNADGNTDLAVANRNGNNVSVLLGIGDGTFQAAVNYSTGTNPAFVAVGDFNSDGKADLALPNEGSNNVSILLGVGNGTFQAAVNYSAGTNPGWIATGDFDGDGRLDVAVANFTSNNVSVLLGNGNGTLQAAVDSAAGTGPYSVAVGDFNADSISDLAVANSGSNNVSVLRGNGNGTFQAAVNYGVGTFPESVAVGDFNGDGKADLVVANNTANNVSVLLGNGDGTFPAAVNYSTASGPTFVVVGDFNGDGIADLAVPNFISGSVSVLLGNGTGTFQAAVNYSVGLQPTAPAVADFNGDGRTDLAVTNSFSNNVSILLGAPVLPDMTVSKSHTGNFTQGQTGATYTITVTNSGPSPTTGTVTMVDTLPASLTATAISGVGWTCTLGTLTCTRSDALAASASYAAITLIVNVPTNAPASVVNSVTVSGGGESITANNTSNDPTTINAVTGYFVGDAAPDLTDLNADLQLTSLGEYGDRLIDNLDLIHALRAVTNIPGFLPSQCSDRFDTMDSFPVDGVTSRGGNGVLNNFDLIQTLRRITGLDTTRPSRTPGSPFCAGASLDAQRRRPVDHSLLQFGAAVDSRTPVYLVSPSRMQAVSLALNVRAGRFVVIPELRPSILDTGIPGVVAAAWLQGLPAPSGGRLLLGWLERAVAKDVVIYGINSTVLSSGLQR